MSRAIGGARPSSESEGQARRRHIRRPRTSLLIDAPRQSNRQNLLLSPGLSRYTLVRIFRSAPAFQPLDPIELFEEPERFFLVLKASTKCGLELACTQDGLRPPVCARRCSRGLCRCNRRGRPADVSGCGPAANRAARSAGHCPRRSGRATDTFVGPRYGLHNQSPPQITILRFTGPFSMRWMDRYTHEYSYAAWKHRREGTVYDAAVRCN